MNKYLNRSKGFEHVWNPETNIKDQKGWIVPYIKGFMQVIYIKECSVDGVANSSLAKEERWNFRVHRPEALHTA